MRLRDRDAGLCLTFNKVHLAFKLCCLLCADGSLVVGASCLTNRYWAGNLFYFNKCDSDVMVDECQVVADLESGVTDISWISETQRVVVACDSGKFARIHVLSIFSFLSDRYLM